jgi:NodT family efflux transporter outer membrane factor (OMF) lipoprotein
MKSFKKFIGIVSILVSILYSGCKTPETIVNTDNKPMPQSFEETKDSTNSADIKWKDFFSDKNLITLVDTALKNNFDVLMTLQKIEIARNDLRVTKGAMLPTVNSNFAYLQRKFGYYTMDDAGNRTTEITPGQIIPTNLPDYFIGLQTNWEIDIWGKLRNKKKASFSRYLSSVEGTNLVLTNLVSEIAIAYYELVELDNELDIIRETIKLQQDALEIIKIQKDAGVANELAVKQFEAEVLNSQGLEFEALQQIAENESKLNFLLGRFPQPIVREKANFTTQIPTQIKAGIPSQLLKNRPDIKQAEFELLATKFDVRAAKAAFYPSFNITGSLGFQSFNTAFLFTSPQSLAYNLLGSLTTPLLNRSAIKNQFNNAKANQIEAMYNYQKTILNGYVEVSNELSSIKNLEQIHDRKTKEVEALTQSIDISNDLFKSGRATYFEVLMIQNRSLQSKLELVNTKKQQYNATVNIYKALGGGWK